MEKVSSRFLRSRTLNSAKNVLQWYMNACKAVVVSLALRVSRASRDCARTGNIKLLACANQNRSINIWSATHPHLNKLHSIKTMLDVEDFDAVYHGLHYNDGLVQEIQSYRTALGGRTFFERLLTLLNIKGKSSSLLVSTMD